MWCNGVKKFFFEGKQKRNVTCRNAQGVPEPEYEVLGGFVRIVFK